MHKGFTLAETLITLGIIGVVAALTLPAVIQNYQKKETVTKLKQTYSLMQQALRMAENDYGDANKWDYVDSKTFSDTYIKPYYKVVQEYEPDDYKDIGIHIYCNNGGDCSNYGSFYKAQKLILTNGVLLAAGPMSSTTADGEEQYNATTIIADINGLKRPNKFGRDVFMFNIDYKKGLIPYGSGSVYNSEDPTLTTEQNLSREELMNGSNIRSCQQLGLFCAAVIMLDGWEIKSDYPW